MNVRAELAAADFLKAVTGPELIETWRECIKLVEMEKNFGALKLMVAAGREMRQRGLADNRLLGFIAAMERIVENDKNES